MSEIIASALYHHLERAITRSTAPNQRHRLFFRLEGFDPETYHALLEKTHAGDAIRGTQLEIRTIQAVVGFEHLKLADGRSATWYRSNLPQNHTLILIFNHPTSDAQSLKDIHPITEATLVHDIEDLARAAISRQLYEDDLEILKMILSRMERVGIATPQLRDLSAFFQGIDRHLTSNPGEGIRQAAAWSLPHLGLFRAPTIADSLGTAKSDRHLKRINDAALLGINPLEQRDLDRYLGRLKNSPLAEGERDLLRRFIEEVIPNRRDLVQVYSIEWDKVDAVLNQRTKVTPSQHRRDLGEDLEAGLAEQIHDGALTELAVDALEALKEGREPSDEALDALYDEAKGLVKKTLERKLNRERAMPQQHANEFLAGLVKLVADLVERFSEAGHDTRIRVSYARSEASTKVSGSDREKQREAIEAEALRVFHLHYHGVETELSEIEFDLGPLWARLQSFGEAEEPSEKVRDAAVTFKVTLFGDGMELSKSELIWSFNSTHTQALTAEHLITEVERQRKAASIPFYNNVGSTRDGVNLDLYDPFETLGTWYLNPADLWLDLGPKLEHRVSHAKLKNTRITIEYLAEAWQAFVIEAEANGLLGSNIEALVQAYATALNTADQIITTDVEASELCSALAKAWIVGEGSYSRWAVVPFLHPLKLHWWLNRTRQLNAFIGALKGSTSSDLPIADVATFKASLESLLNSSGVPAILSLPDHTRRNQYLLPILEVDGYELFRPVRDAGLAFGSTDAFMTTNEGAEAARVASRELHKVLRDYLETFPFAQDGLDMYLFNCRNSALPGMLVNELRKPQRRGPVVRLVVHVERGGAAMYEQVLAWQARHEDEQPERGYLPSTTIRVLTGEKRDLFKHVSDGDIVILADALAHDGLSVDVDLIQRPKGDDFRGYLPTFGAIVEPHRQMAHARRVLLHDAVTEPRMFQSHYRAQWMATNARHLPHDQGVQFRKEMTLYNSKQSLEQLHANFNWVVCYDTTVDRHLIESTISNAVEVIRYSTGLGPRRRHNLTVSSASRTRDAVVQRLASRLSDILPGAQTPERQEIAQALVREAKAISGDLILRAAGPGAFVNELIGVVAARRSTEHARPKAEDEIESWVYLDDFSHWFQKGKYPDLLRIRLKHLDGATPTLSIDVIEAKCVDVAGFLTEARDAQRQVTVGVDRLLSVWRPTTGGEMHLDAPFWYDQLYQGLLSNLTVTTDQAEGIGNLRLALTEGNFNLKVTGHTYVFCHNDTPPTVSSYTGEQVSHHHAESLAEPITTHHFSKSGLHRILVPVSSGFGVALPIPSESEAKVVEDPTTPTPPAQAPRNAPRRPAPGRIEAASPKGEGEGASDSSPPAAIADLAHASLPEEQPPSAGGRNTQEPSDLVWLTPLASDLERVIGEYDIKIYPIDPTEADVGPTVTRFKIRPRPGQRISKLQAIAEDLVYRLALQTTPLIESIPGTPFVGVDLPSRDRKTINLEDVLEQLPEAGPGELPFIVGVAPDGELVTADLAACPHLLVGGSTSSGKSVFLRSLLVCLLEAHSPASLQLLIIDPKRTDFSFFNDLPHLIGGDVVSDAERAKHLLLSLTDEMRRRQKIMQGRSMRIQDFNQRFPEEALPMITVVIDEYAQLVSLMSKHERADFERELMQVAAVARASGIHLILATQRPSADVVTGVLKANLPASVAFKVATRTNSNIVLDTGGAENLMGRGDLRFKKASGEILRLQAPYLDEVTLARFLGRYK